MKKCRIKNKRNKKYEKGITLVSLVVTVSIMLLISGMLIYNAKNGIKMRNLQMMQKDIELLEDKVAAYYMKYGALPAEIPYDISPLPFETVKSANDNENYYVLDLKALEGVTLNYGTDFNNITSESDVPNNNNIYVINEQSHHIYFAKGIEMDGVMYYTNDVDEEISLVPAIEDIYSEEMIGTVIKNTTLDAKLPEGTDNSWIVLGKDEDGSIMLTTSKPIEDGFTLNGTAEEWLSYEDDLNTACSVYGGTIQGQEIKSRSITLEDVNRVTGFVEPSFNTYTFTNEATNDYANKRVNYWHPDENGTATENDGTGDPNFWSKNEITYECDAYYYFLDTSSNTVKYIYEGTNWSEEDYTGILKNTNLILGDGLDYFYFLASRSVDVDGSNAGFDVALVIGDGVLSSNDSSCYSDSRRFHSGSYVRAVPVRPIINLPSNIKVEEVSGEWTIIE